MTRPPFRIGGLSIDNLTFHEALESIATLVEAGAGGTVLTPNIDHVVLAQDDAALRDAYRHASLSLVDGMPILWASRLLRPALPEKVSGSDLVLPLMRLCADRSYRVYFLGGEPGVPERAAQALARQVPGLHVVGLDSPRIDREPSSSEDDAIARLNAACPDVVLVALGCPKQEIFMRRAASRVRPAVLLGVGASLDFWAGTSRRAPPWMSAAGLEWLYRLAREPRRLWRRYLVRDPRFLLLVLRELRQPA